MHSFIQFRFFLNGIIVYLLQVAFVDYWSEVEATMHGSLSIETTDFDNKENYSVRKINLSHTMVRVQFLSVKKNVKLNLFR